MNVYLVSCNVSLPSFVNDSSGYPGRFVLFSCEVIESIRRFDIQIHCVYQLRQVITRQAVHV
jgi:hypothetical protein